MKNTFPLFFHTLYFPKRGWEFNELLTFRKKPRRLEIFLTYHSKQNVRTFGTDWQIASAETTKQKAPFSTPSAFDE
jgi:hypothetical protein